MSSRLTPGRSVWGGTRSSNDRCKTPVVEDTNDIISVVVVHHIPRADIAVMKTFSPQSNVTSNRVSREHPTLDYPTYRVSIVSKRRALHPE